MMRAKDLGRFFSQTPSTSKITGRLQPQRTFSASQDDPILIQEFDRDHKTIILNRPKALNALNLPMIQKIYPTIKQWAKNPTTVVIMKGAGGKAFCSGGDIRAIYDAVILGKGDPSIASEFFYEEYRLNYLLSQRLVTQVSILNGVTMGGGVGLSVHGKYRIATNSSVFAMPEVSIGFFPDVGGSYFLPRLPDNLGYWLALSAKKLTGEDLLRAGIATHYVIEDDLPEVEEKLLKTPFDQIDALLEPYKTPSKKWSIVEDARPIVREGFNVNEGKTLQEILQWFLGYFEKADDFNDAAIAKDFINDTISDQCSPTSLEVTLALLNKGKRLSLEECLKMEYRVSQNMIKAKGDFFEGVRAMLVDKDKKPEWFPSTAKMINDNPEIVKGYFESTGKELNLD